MYKIKNKPKCVNSQLIDEITKYFKDYFVEENSKKELKFKNFFNSKKVSCYSIFIYENNKEKIVVDIAIFKENVNFYDFNWLYQFSQKARCEIWGCNLAAYAHDNKLLKRY